MANADWPCTVKVILPTQLAEALRQRHGGDPLKIQHALFARVAYHGLHEYLVVEGAGVKCPAPGQPGA